MNEQTNPTTDSLKFRRPGIPTTRISLKLPKARTPLSSAIYLISGFFILSVLGMILLMLPFSSSSGDFTNPVTAWFSAVSAVCVTGLVVVDTGTYWSVFGQGVLFALFEIGGLAFIAGATLLIMAIGRGLGLREKVFITESMGTDQMTGILGVVAKVTTFAIICQAIGVIIIYLYWQNAGYTDYTLWTAVFHSASAFNNCGMDIYGNFQSLSMFSNDATILLVTAILALLGSTGYIVFADFMKQCSFRKLTLDSKIVLITSLVLLVAGTLIYLIIEFDNPGTFGVLSVPDKLMAAFFQSVVPRTTGMSVIDVNNYRGFSLFFSMILMLIGGAAGSAAGGIKVNTVGVLFIAAINSLKGKGNLDAFERQIDKNTIYRAITLIAFFAFAAVVIVFLLSISENFAFDRILFEVSSALGTVGLSTGITPELTTFGRIVIIFTMFIGRLAPITLMAVLAHRKQIDDIDYPYESIRLG